MISDSSDTRSGRCIFNKAYTLRMKHYAQYVETYTISKSRLSLTLKVATAQTSNACKPYQACASLMKKVINLLRVCMWIELNDCYRSNRRVVFYNFQLENLTKFHTVEMTTKMKNDLLANEHIFDTLALSKVLVDWPPAQRGTCCQLFFWPATATLNQTHKYK